MRSSSSLLVARHHVERRDRKARREESPALLSVLCALSVKTSYATSALARRYGDPDFGTAGRVR